MRLRDECLEAAMATHHDFRYDERGHIEVVSEAMELVAKRFAAAVLRDAMADWSLQRYSQFSGDDVDRYVAEAIMIVERDV